MPSDIDTRSTVPHALALLEGLIGGGFRKFEPSVASISFGVIVSGVYLSFPARPSGPGSCCSRLLLWSLDCLMDVPRDLLKFKRNALRNSSNPSMLLRGSLLNQFRAFPTNVELNMWHHTGCGQFSIVAADSKILECPVSGPRCRGVSEGRAYSLRCLRRLSSRCAELGGLSLGGERHCPAAVSMVGWVVPRDGPVAGKTRSYGVLVLPEACLETCLEAWSLCFFACGVRWVKFPCFVILDFGSVLSVESHGMVPHLLIQTMDVYD
ncbi:hypothetical protein Tco_1482661 [Tanacetum coccineum]